MNHARMAFGPASIALAVVLPCANASTFTAVGAGWAVTQIDRAATFDALNYATNGAHLENFTEGTLVIATSGNNWVGTGAPDFDPFHGANGANRTFECPKYGNNDWVVIRITDRSIIYAVEFMYGNGWTTGDIYGQYPWGNHLGVLNWETWKNDQLVSSGSIGDTWLLEMGTVVGFIDLDGFDELHVRCTIANSGDPTLQVLALDNLNVQLRQPCNGDVNGDWMIDLSDLATVLADYGWDYATYWDGDVTGDGIVDLSDLAMLLSKYGSACP